MHNNLFNLSRLFGFYLCKVILNDFSYFLWFTKLLCFTWTVCDTSDSFEAIKTSICFINIFRTPEIMPPLLLVIINSFSTIGTYGTSAVHFNNPLSKNTINIRRNAHICKEFILGNFNNSQPVNYIIFNTLDSANFFASILL